MAEARVDISVHDPLAEKLENTSLWIKCYTKSGFKPREEDVAMSLVESTKHHGVDGVRPSDILGVQVIPPMIIINLSSFKAKDTALKQARIQLHGKELTLLDFVTTPLIQPRLTRISIHGVYHSVPDSIVAEWVDKFSVPIERHRVKNASDSFKHLRTGHRFCYVERFTESPPPRFTTISVPHPLNPSELTDIDLEIFCGQGQIVNCRRCKAHDHKAFECPNITCFSCGMSGHTRANCSSSTNTERRRHPTRYQRKSADPDDAVGFSPQTQDSVDLINRAFNTYVRPALPTANRFQTLSGMDDDPDPANIAGAIRDIRAQQSDQRRPPVADADRRLPFNPRNKRRSKIPRDSQSEEPHTSTHLNSDVIALNPRPPNDRYNLRNRKRSLPSPEQRTHSAAKKQNAERSQVSVSAVPSSSQGILKPPRDIHPKTGPRSSTVFITDDTHTLTPVHLDDPLDLSSSQHTMNSPCHDGVGKNSVFDTSNGMPDPTDAERSGRKSSAK
ncbi:hypothetical protein Bbelb_415570 [Branchiostoma belcheri]|nr:hypothetical protein Bbelb_415570 [Branchiostoma belcheri]